MQILEALRHEGAHAARRSIWLFTGAALFASSAIFVAAALAGGLADLMPLYAALLCSALFLVVIGVGCLYAAGRERHGRQRHAPPNVPAALPTRIPDVAYQLLEAEVRARPGKTATAAVVAGLILGALEAIEKHRPAR
jgi:hypothetical protein